MWAQTSVDSPTHPSTFYFTMFTFGIYKHQLSHTSTLANSCCAFAVIALNKNKERPTEGMQVHASETQLRTCWSFPALQFVHECAHWANMVIFCLRFINIYRHASTNTWTLLPPPLIFFPSTRFQSSFWLLCHCSSLLSPPSLTASPPLASLTPTKFHSWRWNH